MWIDLLEVIQQPSPTADLHKQTSPAGMVLLMLPQVLGQRVDPGGQNGDLDLGGPGVHIGPPVLSNQFLFPLFGNGHLLPRLLHLGFGSACFAHEATILPPFLLDSSYYVCVTTY
jgi:hypothetical protein